MSNTEQIIRGAIAGLLALGLAGGGGQALAAKGDNEKCAGIAKAGKNDCGTSKSSCAGTIKSDRDAEAWVFVPKGTCEKIAGGTVTDKPYNAPGGMAAMKK
jgi:uncharacterized membrane protein